VKSELWTDPRDKNEFRGIRAETTVERSSVEVYVDVIRMILYDFFDEAMKR
jgi:hypothetical protein